MNTLDNFFLSRAFVRLHLPNNWPFFFRWDWPNDLLTISIKISIATCRIDFWECIEFWTSALTGLRLYSFTLLIISCIASLLVTLSLLTESELKATLLLGCVGLLIRYSALHFAYKSFIKVKFSCASRCDVLSCHQSLIWFIDTGLNIQICNLIVWHMVSGCVRSFLWF